MLLTPLDAFQTMEYEGSNTRAPRTQSFVRVTPGQVSHISYSNINELSKAFNTVVHQYDEYEDESDIEIKAWINGQPTEAIAWLTTPSGPKYGGNFGEQIAVIESQLIRKGRYLYKVPLKIDPQVSRSLLAGYS